MRIVKQDSPQKKEAKRLSKSLAYIRSEEFRTKLRLEFIAHHNEKIRRKQQKHNDQLPT